MIDFDPEVDPRIVKRVEAGLEGWFADYAAGGLLGEELDPGDLCLPRASQPTLALVEDVHEIAVSEGIALGGGLVELRCRVTLNIEVDLNDEEWETRTTEACLDLTLTIDTRKRAITGHRLHGAWHPAF